MKFITVLIALVLLIQLASMKQLGKTSPKRSSNDKRATDHDVCILGAGASGMSAAVFLKDKGYDVIVIEKDDKVGGHCDTQYFTPPQPGQQNWMELGVQLFPDTQFENLLGVGQWTLGSRQFTERFAPGTRNFVPPQTLNYAYDFINNINIGGPFNVQTPDFSQAIGTIYYILQTQYPWIENAAFPDPIPSELLQPFGNFMNLYNLTVLEPLLDGLMWVGGTGDYHTMPTLYALQNLRRGILLAFNPSTPQAAFNVLQGCSSIYQGITNYLGSDNVILNANVNQVIRNPVMVKVRYTLPGSNAQNNVKCGKLIVAFPQLLDRLGFIDLDRTETQIFQNVRANFYYQVKLEIDGPAANDTLNIASIDALNPSAKYTTYPNILSVIRNLPYGPAVSYAYRLDEVDDSVMYSFVSDKLGQLTSNGAILNQANITDFDLHLYQTHFTTDALSQSPTPYTRLNNLQGHKNTFWVGAILSYAETAGIWQKTFDLINANF